MKSKKWPSTGHLGTHMAKSLSWRGSMALVYLEQHTSGMLGKIHANLHLPLFIHYSVIIWARVVLKRTVVGD